MHYCAKGFISVESLIDGYDLQVWLVVVITCGVGVVLQHNEVKYLHSHPYLVSKARHFNCIHDKIN